MDHNNKDTASTPESDLKHCEQEDLSHPECIQSLGAILVIETATLHLKRWSENIPSLFGVDPTSLSDNQPVTQVLPRLAPFIQRLRSTSASAADPSTTRVLGVLALPRPMNDEPAVAMELLAHQPPSQPEWTIIECIPLWPQLLQTSEADNLDSLNHMLNGFRVVESSVTLDDVIQNSTQFVQHYTQYDRVMLYRFDQDWHGTIVCERTAAHLAPRFMDQHFPASDIPAQARALYKQNRLRLIADVQAQPIPLNKLDSTNAPLDLSHALLRSPSPFHLTYLGNMGVRATLTLSILVNGELWGLLTCHNSEPRVPQHQIRNTVLMMMEMVAGFISGRIGLSEQLEASRRKLTFLQRLNKRDKPIGLATCEQTFAPILNLLKTFLGATGALLVLPDETFTDNLPAEACEVLKTTLTRLDGPRALHDTGTETWAGDLPGTFGIGGVAIFPFKSLPECGLVLTRSSIRMHRNWAGKPGTFGQYTQPDGQVVLGARRSFELWQEAIEHQSEPWPSETLACLKESAELVVSLYLKQEVFRARDFNRLLGNTMDIMADFVVVTDAKKDPNSGKRPIVYANKALCQFTGYSEADLLGRSPDIFQGAETNPNTLKRISDLLNEAKPVEAQLLNYTRAGKPYSIEIMITPVTDDNGTVTHFLSVQRDITQLLQKNQSLKEKTHQLQTLTDKIPGAVYTFVRDERGHYSFEFVSAGFSRLYGLKASEAISFSSLLSQVHPEDRDGLVDSIELSAKALQPWQYGYRLLNRTGEDHRYIQAYSQPYRLENGGVIWYGVLNDVTDTRALEHQIANSQRAMQAILNTIPEVLMELDSQKTIAQVYSGKDTLFNRPIDHYPGVTLESILPADACKKLTDSLHADKMGEAQFTVRQMPEGDASESESHYVIKIAAMQQAGLLEGGYVCSLTDISNRVAEQRQIEYDATHDRLTGLLNREGLDKALVDVIQLSPRPDLITALFIDLDGFKVINDVHGHSTGDALLSACAHRIRDLVGRDALAARVGGDEFLVIIQSPAGANDHSVYQLAETIRQSITRPVVKDGIQYHVSCSIGIASSGDAQDIQEDLMVCTDIALYNAKQDGGGKIRLFEQTMHSAIQYRHRMSHDLRLALKEGGKDFHLVFQPIIEESTIIGHEALLRWHHDSLGLVSPVEFIPVAEQSNLIIDLGHWVLAQAMATLSEWAKEPESSRWVLSINISALQILQDDFVMSVLSMLERTAVPANRLKLEITETLAQFDLTDSVSKLQALRSSGIQCSLDDFGTGYSSLAHLQQLPLDEVKVDQQFIRAMTRDANASAIVRMIKSLAQTLDLRVVAEGVETQEELTLLKAMGYRHFQGYWFGKPRKQPLRTLHHEPE